jgi:hypothetical protein
MLWVQIYLRYFEGRFRSLIIYANVLLRKMCNCDRSIKLMEIQKFISSEL